CDRIGDAPIRLGEVIANTDAHVLDAALHPVPAGVPGELYLGGEGLARGYLRRPGLSAERFVASPFRAGGRMYRTGDLVRLDAEGRLEFLGRVDHQVKIRGFRIELGEIEAQLAKLPGVAQAAVVARDDAQGLKRLVGYVTGEGESLRAAELRAALAASLPDHMIPAAIVVLEAMPATANGKIDRKALPAPEADAIAQREYAPPQGALETLVAEQWAQLFGLHRIGRNDQFFELGGHSLTAMQLAGKLRRLGHPVDVRTLFEHPTLADFAAHLGEGQGIEIPENRIPADADRIVPAMLPLVSLAQDDIDRIVAATPGGVANVQDIYPLSPLQDGILFHYLLDAGNDPYRQTMRLRFDSRQRLERYLDAMRGIVAHHDILRTAFHWQRLSQPVQVVQRDAPLRVDKVDFAALEAFAGTIDPSRAPLLRFVAAPEPEGDGWQLLQIQHHLIGDRSTVDGLLEDVSLRMRDAAAVLPPAQPYRNLVAHARLGVPDEVHERFFRAMLSDIDEPCLPFGLADVHGAGDDLDEARLSLPASLVASLRATARRRGVTVASLCHLAWALVVARTSGREQAVFGSVLLGRMQGGERALGLSINTLPLRLDIGDAPVADALRECHARLAGLIRHEHASLSLAQRCSAVPQPAPLFSALFNYRHDAAPDTTGGSRLPEGIAWLGGDERTNYPLILSVDDYGASRGGDAMDLVAQIARPHDAARVTAQMQQALESLLSALESAPSKPLRELDILPEAERRFVLKSLNDTAAPHRESLCMHQPFEQMARERPTLRALVCGERALTYAELNREANRLAHTLIARGVRPDDRVAICVDRSVEMVVGLLGILKAGGAYLPLDPSYPADRLGMILDDAAPSLLLTDEAGRRALDGNTGGATVLALDDAALVDGQPDVDPDTAAIGLTSRHLAYVIYTSGSTGIPKGVQNEHRALANRLDWIQDAYRIGPEDVVLQKTPFGFDVSVWEFFWTLAQGSTLVMAPPDAHKDPAAMASLIVRHGVTTLHFVPSMLAGFVEYDGAGRCTSLQRIICSGEALPAATLRKTQRILPSAMVYNLYGPTEAAIDVTAWTCPPGFDGEIVPIGKPIWNTQMYLLDAQGRPVPFGVVGELYIGGVGVARGYLNRDALNAERFLPDPFSADPEARLYRTGDVARFLPDGNIDFLGRNDHQVKLRGFRIELGEIETALSAMPEVAQCVVVAREDTPGDKRLVAYVATRAPVDTHAFIAAAKAELSIRLPEYMVPAAYVLLETMPLSSNGKLDRKALPAPTGDDFLRDAYVPPQGAVELAIAEAWSRLLGVERVGRNDHFFQLGGHSLLAVRLIEQLRRQDIHLDIRTLFLHPRLAELAASLGDERRIVAPPNRIPEGALAITPDMLPLIDLSQADIDRIASTVPGGIGNIQDIYALSALQDGILFHHLLATQGDPYLQVNRLAFPDRAHFDRYLAAVQQVVDRHDILRTAFVWEQMSAPAQVVLRQASVHVEEVQLDPAEGPAIDALARRFEARRYRIDLGQAPLLRFAIAREPDSGRWLVLQMQHHLIDDVSSLSIMLGEIRAILDGRGDALPPPLQFREMVAQGRMGRSNAEHEAFFRAMLADIDEPTLPFGLADVHRDGSAMDDGERLLPAALNDRLRNEARRLGVSVASLFHLAWGLVVARASGRDRVVFGTVLFGRMQAGTGADRAMGLFINTLPVRLDLSGTGVEAAVLATHARLAELMHHEHASLALAQRCSGVAAPSPLFSALLNYRHYDTVASAGPDPLPGVTWLSGEERSNYPFTLSVDDRGDALGLNVQVAKPHSAERICGYMQQALEGLLDALQASPTQDVRRIDVMPAAERTQVLQTWNATDRDLPLRPFPALFERQARATPDAIALAFDDVRLSYAELDRRANQVAHLLHQRGVGPEHIVGLALPRGIEVIVALLGIFKAGAAFLPLDPDYPAERLAYMVEDARPVLTLATADSLRTLPEGITACRWDDPDTQRAIDAAPTDAPAIALGVDHPAYVIYTSGSTGKPKGVVVTHRGLGNTATSLGERFGVGTDGRVLQFASHSFDAAISEIALAFMAGATLVLARADDVLSAQALARIVDRERISYTTFPPALLPELDPAAMPTLTSLGVAGDACPGAVVRAWSPGRCMLNEYGPTEATICATTSAPLSGEDKPAIGTPLANTRVYVLDAQLQPVPVGVPGELYIAGRGLARGYLRRPALTAERFVANPFTPGARMYRTGDLVRWLPTGELDFLGRVDHQVKLRGFRVEPGEIEAQLRRLPGVAQAAVIAREDRPGQKQLVAYVVAEGGRTLDTAGLRRTLSEHLPEYMVPAAVVAMAQFPLTPNGKLDRAALPAPDFGDGGGSADDAPRTPQEQTLAALFAEVLGIERVGIHGNFFDLGGHSLLATRLLGRIRSSFSVDVTIRTLFEAPTVAQLAERIAQAPKARVVVRPMLQRTRQPS
ncbi:amino acid adenylation domain-containing protein, partial [Lysobacter hankyongensis]|uniref:amino acid adenylation domain-containing protein n=1 Tax=Lysobacter hankyongensis TaxID=1176535 RepID=UPI0031E74C63